MAHERIEKNKLLTNMLRALEDPPIPPFPDKPFTFSIVGAGQRGTGYADYATSEPRLAKVVAVAEPVEIRRKNMQKKYNIPDENSFSDWRELAKRPKLSDVVVIATLDHSHAEPAVVFADLKYHILLEKPMADNLEDCKKITEAAIKNQILFAIGHVLRYTPHNLLVKKIIDSGYLGKVINIQHLEPVGNWHFAHSYVRGNWRKEQDSCFSLMTKCCHDIDLVAHWNDSPCVKISSFGNLSHFTSKNKPTEAGNTKRCLDCEYEPSCAYSAKKIYIKSFESGNREWPVSVVSDVVDIEHLVDALKTGPYGRCVYECDNDVADHQVVNMEFASGATATITMVAFTEAICTRKLECDGLNNISYYSFQTKRKEILRATDIIGGSISGGHGGGDFGLMRSFLYAIASGNNSPLSGAEEALDSHLYVFAAENSKRTGKVVNIEQFRHETNNPPSKNNRIPSTIIIMPNAVSPTPISKNSSKVSERIERIQSNNKDLKNKNIL
ncbi:6310_t:CDS:10 [Funneliformis geosporum]|uniref:6310_t:CDS:1 n=1 Tax=Funneliformis geosporum TaxID=1117311 RepID=A0A9W4SEQ9_9GLOM|nr:6310_t:CDS:10 [Funneliformis geosporum]